MLVKINSDDPKEISRLHGIGEETAKRIIEHRKQNGTYRGPDDLAKVKGIGIDMASALSPHIDWQEVDQISGEQKTEDFTRQIFEITFFIIMMMGATLTLPSIYSINPNLDFGTSLDFFDAWNFFSLLIFNLSMLTIFMLGRRKISIIQAQKYLRFQFVFLFTAYLAACFYIAKINLYEPQLLHHLIDFKSTLHLQASIFIYLFFWAICQYLPSVLVLIQPKLLVETKVATWIELGLLITGASTSILLWGNWQRVSTVEMLAILGVGLLYVAFGFWSLKTDVSSVYYFLSFIVPKDWTGSDTTSDWLAWINYRLPDPQKQRELMEALETIYPRRRSKIVTWTLISAIGIWLILNSIEAILEWIIQNILNKLF